VKCQVSSMSSRSHIFSMPRRQDSGFSKFLEAPDQATYDALAASATGSVTAFAHELTVALLGHPARAGEMAVMDVARAFRLALGVDAEQD
jgi:hypothetical protein